ncbi:MAG: hypothetical protein ACI319_07485 [Holdemanella porci]
MKYILIFLFLLTGCSSPSFIGKEWEREVDYGIENISFWENGHFSYYDDAGEPVEDSDLIDQYVYDKDNQVIHLDNGQDIKVFQVTQNKLILEFDGEKRIFWHK